MAAVQARNPYTDNQVKNRLAELEAPQQISVLIHFGRLLEKESDVYMSALTESRKCFAAALLKLKDRGEEKSEQARDDDVQIKSFESTTAIGNRMAEIGGTFADYLDQRSYSERKIEEAITLAQKKAVDNYKRTLAESDVNAKPNETVAAVKETEETIRSLKKNLVPDLNDAARKEQEIIVKKMTNHGRKIDAERKRQMEITKKKLNEAKGKEVGNRNGNIDTIGTMISSKNELDEMYEEDRNRQEKALEERLKGKKDGSTTNVEKSGREANLLHTSKPDKFIQS
ncbi:unnamed protein product [Calicophoron daubneyi]|uniref:Uncharacterized protein n=1 Tax=Calicophoron daubneyi TaxID=300641 RepID=A0AAV2T9R2_CALDB